MLCMARRISLAGVCLCVQRGLTLLAVAFPARRSDPLFIPPLGPYGVSPIICVVERRNAAAISVLHVLSAVEARRRAECFVAIADQPIGFVQQLSLSTAAVVISAQPAE